MAPRKGRPPPVAKSAQPNWTAVAVHVTLILAFGGVWGWHLTPKANEQEVAQKTGWFWQYYTFLGFSLQLIQFFIALVADFQPRGFIAKVSDTFSCSVMAMAVFITQFYYCLLLTGNIVDSDDVPSWVSPALHTGNFAGLILDWYVAASKRTFKPASSFLLAGINVAYMALVYYLRQVNGDYTYAFLQKAPEPWGVIGSTFILVIGAEANFLLLRKIRNWKRGQS